MQIRAILRFRNEDLTRKRLVAGFRTQKELADSLGIQATIISEYETFKSYPKKEERIKAIESALNCKIEEIFPPEFIRAIDKKLGTPLEKVIDIKQLPGFTRGELLLPSPEEAYELKEEIKLKKNSIKKSLESLYEREAKVLKMRFGLENYGEHTLEEIAQQFRISRERIRQIEAKALRKLKHKSRSRELRDFVEI